MAGLVIIQSKDVVRSQYREPFERAGYFVHETAEGLKALRGLHERSMDLVITDIHLSDCDSLEFIASPRRG
ncbi:response regulator [Nitrospira sp. Nam80]